MFPETIPAIHILMDAQIDDDFPFDDPESSPPRVIGAILRGLSREHAANVRAVVQIIGGRPSSGTAYGL